AGVAVRLAAEMFGAGPVGCGAVESAACALKSGVAVSVGPLAIAPAVSCDDGATVAGGAPLGSSAFAATGAMAMPASALSGVVGCGAVVSCAAAIVVACVEGSVAVVPLDATRPVVFGCVVPAPLAAVAFASSAVG